MSVFRLLVVVWTLLETTTVVVAYISLANRVSGRCPYSGPLVSRTYHVLPSSNDPSSASSTKHSHQDMLNFMDRAPFLDGDRHVPTSAADDSEFVRCIVQAADGRKAENIVALHVYPITTLTSYLVILSGNSRPQNQAICSVIQKDVAELYNGRQPRNGVPEGSAESGWMLLDYGNVMVHVMTPKSRLYYNLEGVWRDKGAKPMDLSDILVPNRVVNVEKTFETEEEEDPFWS